MPLKIVRASSNGRQDSRHDSPMRQESDASDDPAESGGSRNRTPSEGFTAVNGHRRAASSRPDDSPGQETASRDDGPSPPSNRSRTARPPRDRRIEATSNLERDGDPLQPDESQSNKRRRTDSATSAVENGYRSDRNRDDPIPDRTATQNAVTRAISSEIDDQDSHSESERRDRHRDTPLFSVYPGDRSSDSNRPSEREPLPPPRPETEAGIAESLRRELAGPRGDFIRRQDDGSNENSPGRHTTEDAVPYQLQSPRDEQNNQEEGPIAVEDFGTAEDAAEEGSGKKRKRNFSNRTKTGCHTCRARKKKCDEGKPTCENCRRGGFECAGYGPRPPTAGQPFVPRNAPTLMSRNTYGPAQAPQPGQGPGPISYFPAPPDPATANSHRAWVPQPHGHSYETHHPPPPPPPPSRPPWWEERGWPDSRRPSSRDGWPHPAPWGPPEGPHAYPNERTPRGHYAYPNERAPPVPYGYANQQPGEDLQRYSHERAPESSQRYPNEPAPDGTRRYTDVRPSDGSYGYPNERTPEGARQHSHGRAPEDARRYSTDHPAESTPRYSSERHPDVGQRYPSERPEGSSLAGHSSERAPENSNRSSRERARPKEPTQMPPPSGHTSDHRSQGSDGRGRSTPTPLPAPSGINSMMHPTASTTPSCRTRIALAYHPSGELTERSKMMIGRPYRHFVDEELIRDRQSCRRAVEAYNDATRVTSAISPMECEKLFNATMVPSARAAYGDWAMRDWRGPAGSCGTQTIVSSPFSCEFGYNLHFGDNVVISPNCSMQDACEIFIGHRTVIGPDVKFYTVTASLDPNARGGSLGMFVAGRIIIEEDCYIGGNVTIMPYRTIGRGAVVGAGSVVTRDVPPYTIWAGVPAMHIRDIKPGTHVDNHENGEIQAQNEKVMRQLQGGLEQGCRLPATEGARVVTH